MTPEQRKFLEELGFDWDPLVSQWNEGYEHLKEYREREGHCRVPAKFKTESGYRLGQWVDKQRQAQKRGTLTPERRKLLDDLGFERRVKTK